ncbi:hypothetical protein SDC9_205162 [bioreactor metagenome]|uniref:Uncharacterized protein n=1 Tax=bioreactor metagenome TaxID=1076179 RepID=A0A645J1B1_9ZZZZ
MLEEVGIQRTIGQRQVRLHIVVELDQLDLVALLLQQRHDASLQLVDVGACGAADDELLLAGILRECRGADAERCGRNGGHGGCGDEKRAA